MFRRTEGLKTSVYWQSYIREEAYAGSVGIHFHDTLVYSVAIKTTAGGALARERRNKVRKGVIDRQMDIHQSDQTNDFSLTDMDAVSIKILPLTTTTPKKQIHT